MKVSGVVYNKSIKKTAKHIVEIIGSIIAVIGVFFIGLKIYQDWEQVKYVELTVSNWLLIGLVIIFCLVANLFLPLGWRRLLKSLGESPKILWCIRIYGITQLAKYAPGNIFHFAGRQAMGMEAGLKGWQLAKSAFWEIIFFIFGGSMFVFLLIPMFYPKFTEYSGIVFFVLSLVLCLAFFFYKVGKSAMLAFIFYVINMMVAAFCFVLLVNMLEDIGGLFQIKAAEIGAAFIIGWLAGLVTPGAPAGLGVREMVLLALLGPIVSEANLIMAILITRIANVGGDILFFVLAWFIPKTDPHSS